MTQHFAGMELRLHGTNTKLWTLTGSFSENVCCMKRTKVRLLHGETRPNTACLQEFHKLVSPKTKLVSLVHISNALGAVLDTQQVCEAARKVHFVTLTAVGVLLQTSMHHSVVPNALVFLAMPLYPWQCPCVLGNAC